MFLSGHWNWGLHIYKGEGKDKSLHVYGWYEEFYWERKIRINPIQTIWIKSYDIGMAFRIGKYALLLMRKRKFVYIPSFCLPKKIKQWILYKHS